MNLEVIVQLDGEVFQHLTGTLAEYERLEVARFVY